MYDVIFRDPETNKVVHEAIGAIVCDDDDMAAGIAAVLYEQPDPKPWEMPWIIEIRKEKPR
jgi:hypothetical protein